MDLNAVKLFVQAAEAGSISAAARRTGIPLPTLSRQLRKLEDDLGMRLLERGPRGLALTPAGNQLISDAQPALASLAQAEQRLYDASGVAGRLRISVPPHLETLWPLFRAFGRRYPAVTFEVFVTDRRVDLVADGIDIAIRVGERGAAGYVGRTLTRYRHRLIASPKLLAHHAISSPLDLTRVPCACWRSPGASVWHLGETQVDLEPVFITNDYLHLLRLAEAGDVVTEVPPFLAARGLERGQLVEPLPQHPLPEHPMRALVVERRSIPPLVRQFLDYASANVAQALGISL
ncbi:MAG: LysR family transcriptional regulator [Deltaproteobacteria bacterium]|nr:LysR family transcriptional regulator [Deltaproteobacteria bacterium]